MEEIHKLKKDDVVCLLHTELSYYFGDILEHYTQFCINFFVLHEISLQLNYNVVQE